MAEWGRSTSPNVPTVAYQLRVALKVIRGPAAQGDSARFNSETHILARLSHPNIARMIDAGHTPEGSSYLVMEYVDGSPVTSTASALRLTVDERLRLFRRSVQPHSTLTSRWSSIAT